MWTPTDDERLDPAADPADEPRPGPGPGPVIGAAVSEPAVVDTSAPSANGPSDSQALDDFFDEDEELGEDRRFASRLRRRR